MLPRLVIPLETLWVLILLWVLVFAVDMVLPLSLALISIISNELANHVLHYLGIIL